MKQLVSIALFLVTYCLPLRADSTLFCIQIKPLFNNNTLNLQRSYTTSSGDTLQITSLRFYLSNIRLLSQGKILSSPANSYHLIDLSDSLSTTLFIPIPERSTINQVQFMLGVDSITQSSGVMGGDLDPTKGMYWTWQSGYIHLKIEGTHEKSSGPRHQFQLHIGGASTSHTLTVNSTGNILQLRPDFNLLLNKHNFNAQPRIMSPGANAINISHRFYELFIKCATPR